MMIGWPAQKLCLSFALGIVVLLTAAPSSQHAFPELEFLLIIIFPILPVSSSRAQEFAGLFPQVILVRIERK
jgi:hypothetical protein